jgi:hypothetical protein
MSLTPRPDQRAVDRYCKANPFVPEETARQLMTEVEPFREISLSLATFVSAERVPTHRQVHCVLSLVSDLLAFDLRRIAIERDCETGDSLLVQPTVMIWQADSAPLRLGRFYNIPAVRLQGVRQLQSEAVTVQADALLGYFFTVHSSQEESPVLSACDGWLSEDLPLLNNQSGRVETLATYRSAVLLSRGWQGRLMS